MQFAQIAAGFFGVDSRSVFLYNRKQSPHAMLRQICPKAARSCFPAAGHRRREKEVFHENSTDLHRRRMQRKPRPRRVGAILRYGTAEKELSGGAAETTNNRMELTGVISALAALKEPCQVLLTTDSKYVVDSITKGWVYGWKKRGWVKSDKKPALNVDLWEQLLPLLERHKVTFHWVKGHAGHPENERCDQLAVMQRDIYAQ